MNQDALADRYKTKFAGDTKGITSLTASVKRTATALDKISVEFSTIGQLSEKDKAVLLNAKKILLSLSHTADKAKSDVKRHADEKLRLQERLKKEAEKAVAAAFQIDQVENAVAFLAWENKIRPWFGDYWRSALAGEIHRNQPWHKNRPGTVANELQDQVRDLMRELTSSVAFEAESKGRSVSDIVAEIRADFEAKLPVLVEREQKLIKEIKTASVAQALEAVNGKKS